MAKNKNSFNPASGLFNQENKETAPIVTNVKIEPQRTQGRKGHKLPRINMAFQPINHEYIKRVSRQKGISMTDYVNQLIDNERNHNS